MCDTKGSVFDKMLPVDDNGRLTTEDESFPTKSNWGRERDEFGRASLYVCLVPTILGIRTMSMSKVQTQHYNESYGREAVPNDRHLRAPRDGSSSISPTLHVQVCVSPSPADPEG